MTKKCKFTTVKRILLPLNTNGNKISFERDNHWMLGEMHLATGEVIIYDWFLSANCASCFALVAIATRLLLGLCKLVHTAFALLTVCLLQFPSCHY